MKQFNLEQKVFAELLLEQSQKEIEVDIVVKQIIAFLSRLCGGERADNSLMPRPLFLSRLCGGERLT